MGIDSKTVMIADSDDKIRRLVGRFLTDAGYKIEEATDGYEALDKARKIPPSIVLADILLPKLDGLALCRLLKSDSVTEKVVTVIVFSVLDAEKRALESGAAAFIRKPLEKNRLLSVLESVIHKVNV